ncbi:electron transport complex subunit RsxC [Rhodocyclus tenuis]|uniref:Ion-translocating oxidoreductase complex subunit C n=2 Tax=Rhodocyclus TaxID=1064 RepID=A0A6L5JW45_RHOTE|nr:electron transport complex subunit RsxC [Rhodocyclus gracilis]MQY51459.1 electron transport complex subunit RsxC [Rhodocyclus gracilis]MRD72201.1 electron transport complex subunit RsxC [Rhodocyclus gracilis]NJA89307.1 electron transport complex subunit RsxC [Rhodocyclus gracilis]
MNFLSYFRNEAFERGIHPPSCKLTADTPIRRLPFAPRLVVPLSQHIGKPALPVVRVGEEVQRGQLIARADDGLSVPHHAPATGVVEAIELRPSARGPWAPAIVIRVHPGSSQEDLCANPRDLAKASSDELRQAIRDSGMVGLGGAAFPTYAKLAIPAGAKAHTLVVNGCECEPYLTCDHRVMVEEADDLIAGIRYGLRATGAVRAIIGVEDNKPAAVAAIKAAIARHEAAGQPDGAIFVEAVPTKYPQGSEKMLLMALFGVEVPSGKLPISLGMVVNNVGTLAALGRLLPSGRGLTERVVTITGPGVSRPGDYRVPLGTPLRFILDYAGAPAGMNDARQVILGGPMMGQALPSLDIPITKGVSGVLVFRGEDLAQRENVTTYPCIKCGECVGACPMGLNPSQLGMLAAKREYDAMAEGYFLGECFECGCCTYVCPSNIPLVQQFRVAKQVLREKSAK